VLLKAKSSQLIVEAASILEINQIPVSCPSPASDVRGLMWLKVQISRGR
jgi:hypothetical protein